jgi:uncharacterized protein with PQ loop repeat
MSTDLINIAGWIPAVVLPVATAIQLIKIVGEKSIEGVSIWSWLLFGFANIGMYIFTEKYWAVQSILGLLVTAVMDFIIVALVIRRRF